MTGERDGRHDIKIKPITVNKNPTTNCSKNQRTCEPKPPRQRSRHRGVIKILRRIHEEQNLDMKKESTKRSRKEVLIRH